MTAENAQRSNKRTLLLILLTPVMVLIPFALIYWLADAGLMKYETFNRGELINPPIHIDELNLSNEQGRLLDYQQPEALWSLLIIGDRFCNDDCEKMLYLSRQVNTAMGKKANKLRRFYINRDGLVSAQLKESLSRDYTKLRVLNITDSHALSQLPEFSHRQGLYLVDRGGWIMMMYQSDNLQAATLNQLGKDLLRDLNRLIK